MPLAPQPSLNSLATTQLSRLSRPEEPVCEFLQLDFLIPTLTPIYTTEIARGSREATMREVVLEVSSYSSRHHIHFTPHFTQLPRR